MPGPRPDWWKTHFDPETLSGYALGAKTAAEVRGVVRLLGLGAPADILDLGCGLGRHSLGLAALGHRVVGLDWSAAFVKAAAKSARGTSASFVRGDMRRLRFRRRFDAVINLFTSFGYFDTEAEDLSVLRGVRRALRPGGSFLIDLLNKRWLLRHFTPTFWQRSADGKVLRAFNRLSFDRRSSRLSNERTLYLRGGRVRLTRLQFKVYSLTAMERLLAAAGLSAAAVWGGFDARPCDGESFRMIIRAKLRPRPIFC